ncbi:hypothetical protein WAI453_007072 [Rhynchosporium graminicola]|uniref:Chitin-binding type-4 domain-containing protein n=1 Tax=Rhynchosporium graminicola TaxID=2792576 RepID=A0A1E1LH61_9HELO|nr:uncharacterized protein RCO7_02211 [Rhynchosporium commune]
MKFSSIAAFGAVSFACGAIAKQVCVCKPRVAAPKIAALNSTAPSDIAVTTYAATTLASITTTTATSEPSSDVYQTSYANASHTTPTTSARTDFAVPTKSAGTSTAIPDTTYLHMKNSCGFDVHYDQAWHMGHAHGFILPAGESVYMAMEGQSKVIKLHRGEGHDVGIVQYEWSRELMGMFQDVSHVDADGLGPFRSVNVRLQPQGEGAGKGTCVEVFCKAHEECKGSYQYWNDHNTKFCGNDVTHYELEFCAQ